MPMISEVRAPKRRRDKQVAAEQCRCRARSGAGRQRRAFQRQPVEELLVGIVRGDHRGEQAERQQHQNEAKTDHRQPVAAKAPPEILHAELPIRDDLQTG